MAVAIYAGVFPRYAFWFLLSGLVNTKGRYVWFILCKSPRRFPKLYPFPLVQQCEHVLHPLSAQMALTRLLSFKPSHENAQLPRCDFPCHPPGTHRHGSYSQVAVKLLSRHLLFYTI